MAVPGAKKDRKLYKLRRYIRNALLFTFFFSVLANVFILITTHTHEHILDYEDDILSLSKQALAKTLNLSELGIVLPGNDTNLNNELLKTAVALCIRERKNKVRYRAGSTQIQLAASLEYDLYENLTIPSSVDTGVMRSLNYTMQQEARSIYNVFRFLHQPIINKHDFRYIHNPHDTCRKRKIDLVIAVVSAAHQFESRTRTRKGLKGGYSDTKSNNSTLLFFLGNVNPNRNESRSWQVLINMEMRMHGDLIQEDFIDSYRNLSRKAMSVLKWITKFCPHAQFVIKADDDAGLKPAPAVAALKRYREKHGNFILGRWNPNLIVQRNSSKKSYVPVEEYPLMTFPPHLLGGALAFPVSTAKLLYQASLRVKPMRMDDAFLTAICASKVNVPLFMDAQFDFKHRQW